MKNDWENVLRYLDHIIGICEHQLDTRDSRGISGPSNASPFIERLGAILMEWTLSMTH